MNSRIFTWRVLTLPPCVVSRCTKHVCLCEVERRTERKHFSSYNQFLPRKRPTQHFTVDLKTFPCRVFWSTVVEDFVFSFPMCIGRRKAGACATLTGMQRTSQMPRRTEGFPLTHTFYASILLCSVALCLSVFFVSLFSIQAAVRTPLAYAVEKDTFASSLLAQLRRNLHFQWP